MDQDIKNLFPDRIRRIIDYLSYYIDSKDTGYELSKIIIKDRSMNDLINLSKKGNSNLFKTICLGCDYIIKDKNKSRESKIICPYCGYQNNQDEKDKNCGKCNKFL